MGSTFFRIQLALFAVMMAGMLMLLLSLFLNNPRDTTDPPDGRSGMKLLTDHATGCQYLYRSGGITPRMSSDGRHMCGMK